MTNNELIMLQALPLEVKVMKTKQRIKEWINHWGANGVYVSYSGGKDSEVLVDIARSIYPDIKIVFSNTGQEFPEIINQVLKRKKQGYNIDIVKPKIRFKEVIEKYGYPVISKEVSMAISRYRNTKSEDVRNYRLHGRIVEGKKQNAGTIPKKFHQIALNEEFKISEKCCDVLKKGPMATYERLTKRKAIVGTMAVESKNRKTKYLKTGCNSFEGKAQSNPLGFWTDEDILGYIATYNLEISEMYTKHRAERTGCYGCLFGCHLEEKKTGTNRIVKLKETHPLLYNHLMNDLNYKKVMDTLKLRTE